eukprot:365294-Chlamydomonas_euryale.AAC.3
MKHGLQMRKVYLQDGPLRSLAWTCRAVHIRSPFMQMRLTYAVARPMCRHLQPRRPSATGTSQSIVACQKRSSTGESGFVGGVLAKCSMLRHATPEPYMLTRPWVI